jgi:hypothetical protein
VRACTSVQLFDNSKAWILIDPKSRNFFACVIVQIELYGIQKVFHIVCLRLSLTSAIQQDVEQRTKDGIHGSSSQADL